MARTEDDQLGPERSPGIRRAASSVVILAAIFALSYFGLRPPAPKPANIPQSQFSATRAVSLLGQIFAGDKPHPVGSAADDAIRGRIVAQLTSFGYDPQVQSAFDCNGYGNCVVVNNVLARIDGTDTTGGAVLLAAHYDSVPAGPGASDDGASSAAVLEIAHDLKSLPRPRHSIIFLVDEGEEPGLLGARAFVDWHPWAREVRAAVNLDARGTSGASLLFETGTANQWIIQLFKSSASRPVANSIFYDVYRALPNDTDMTVFKSVEEQGANFAFIGDEPQYHTPLDNLGNVDEASVQHQGDNALAMVWSLANGDISNPPEKEAVYFDVFGRHIFEWPASRTLMISIIAALLFAVQIALLFWTKRMAAREFLSGLAAFVLALISTGALALILDHLLRLLGALPVNWVAHSLPVRIAFWVLALAVVVIHGIAFARRARFWGLWTGVWAWWMIGSIVLSSLQPGLSFIMQVPACAAVLVGLPVVALWKDNAFAQWLAGIIPMAAAAIVAFEPLIVLYTAMGTPVLIGIAMSVALILTPLIPLCVDLSETEGLLALSIPGVPIVVAGLAIFGAIVVPAYSAQAPERVNFQFWQDADTGKAQWVVEPESGKLPEPISLATSFHNARTGELPWAHGSAFLADAPALDVNAPSFTVLDSVVMGDKRQFRALLRSERGASVAMVMFPPDSGVGAVQMEDVAVPAESARVRSFFNGWFIYACPSMPAKGVEMSFMLPMGKPVTVIVVDHSYGLPDDGTFLTNARPLTAVPSGDGDLTVLSRRVQLNP
ncbi:MAG TPA: M28 family peptidase [Candidatus Acidoferrales bacterium]